MEKRKLSKLTLFISRFLLIICGFLLGAYLIEGLVKLLDLTLSSPITSVIDEAVILLAEGISGVIVAVILFILAPNIVLALISFIKLIEKGLSRFSAKELVCAGLGLVLGLIAAFFISTFFTSIEIRVKAVLVILLFLDYIILALLGMRLGLLSADLIFPSQKKDTSEGKTVIIDTSAIIDGRIYDMAKTGFLYGNLYIPSFVIDELTSLSENPDPLKRERGRRGLDILTFLQDEKTLSLTIGSNDESNEKDTDKKLLELAEKKNAAILTVDYNFNKIANLKKIKILNVNELANAIKPVVIPGEKMIVKIVKEGKEHNQGLAYLPDGTMIVVENGGGSIGRETEVYITTSMQTSAGRLIFARIEE